MLESGKDEAHWFFAVDPVDDLVIPDATHETGKLGINQCHITNPPLLVDKQLIVRLEQADTARCFEGRSQAGSMC